MISNIDADNPDRSRHEGMWCGSRRSSGIFCGLVLTVIGALWLGKKTGLIPLDMDLFWPSVMVIAGVWMLAAAILRRRRTS
jgi:hypothetical protein